MNKYETRILDKEDAIAFVQNVKWYAGVGQISWKKLDHDRLEVRATKHAWSMWISNVVREENV